MLLPVGRSMQDTHHEHVARRISGLHPNEYVCIREPANSLAIYQCMELSASMYSGGWYHVECLARMAIFQGNDSGTDLGRPRL